MIRDAVQQTTGRHKTNEGMAELRFSMGREGRAETFSARQRTHFSYF